MNGGGYEIAGGDKEEIYKEKKEVDDGQPGGDAGRNGKRAVAKEQKTAQDESRKNKADTDEIEFSGGGQGGESGDDEKEERRDGVAEDIRPSV